MTANKHSEEMEIIMDLEDMEEMYKKELIIQSQWKVTSKKTT